MSQSSTFNPEIFDARRCSYFIRRDLRYAFPGTKFSVRQDLQTDHRKMIVVRWTNGPEVSQVRTAVDRWLGYDWNEQTYSFVERPAIKVDGELLRSELRAIHLERERLEEPMSDRESLVDTALLDWIDNWVDAGVMEAGTEMDGGIYLYLSAPGKDVINIREAKNIRVALMAAINESGGQKT